MSVLFGKDSPSFVSIQPLLFSTEKRKHFMQSSFPREPVFIWNMEMKVKASIDLNAESEHKIHNFLYILFYAVKLKFKNSFFAMK